ncbi:hypothetical protein [Pseudomonas fluorescens]|uniref:hypothetical protein n=1 Tax=Pseudomonas fluorescens TaxID=294 RepID=UPI001A9CF053|nr:hypothetical protein [Pseudomonas fluorescens]QTD32715.1 hypothetical protein JZM58_26210 [Pseudomonas fluorescens]
MSAYEETLAAIRAQFAGTETGIALEYSYAQDHPARVNAVQRAVDFACNKLVKHRDKKQKDSEDGLTVQICDLLNTTGMQATHDASIGGHCDIAVEGKDDFLWLAEAKKHKDYAWLDKGFKQLSTRYTTCIPGQEHGDLLIYCFVENAKWVLDKWKDELVIRNSDVSVIEDECKNPLIFRSTHLHKSSGLTLHVRHKILPLHWDPKDK